MTRHRAQRSKTDRAESRWTVEPDRHIYFGGQPFVHIDKEREALPVEADSLVHVIVEHLNRSNLTPADLYERAMGFKPPSSAGRAGEPPRVHERRSYSMTYGELPPYEKFIVDIRRPDPDESNERAYWPEGTAYPMELVDSHEEQLALDYGLEQFETERARTGRNSNAIGFRGNEEQIYGFLGFLVEAFENGDEQAGDLASSIMSTLGYEWI